MEPSFESSAQAPQAITQSIEYQNHFAFAVEEVGKWVSNSLKLRPFQPGSLARDTPPGQQFAHLHPAVPAGRP